MKYFELNREEKQILKDFETGKLKRVANFAREKNRYQEAARATLGKKMNINLRISEKTLQKLKAQAAIQGLPYQTLAASILHRYSLEQI